MKSALLKNKIIAAFGLCLLITGIGFAQTSNSKVKRNSPFAPNPKGKTQIAKNANAEINSATMQKVVNIEAADDIGEPISAKIESAPLEGIGEASPESPKTDETKIPETAARTTSNLLPTEIYKVGIGDILYISLQNAPAKESTYFTILKDGTIDYPLAGEMVSVAGLTTNEIENVLQEKIKLYENPQVSVKVRENNSHAYTVLGMVEKPGEKFLQREAYPLLVVRAEAIVQARANRAVIKRSNAQTETVDLRDAKSEDVLIYSGDIVEFNSFDSVSEGAKQFYYIGGEIVSGGQKDFLKGITLTQAILASGGLKKQSIKKVVIRRKNEAGMLTPTTFDLKAVKDGKIADPEIEAGDTIEIGN